jgi:hypothetical protein
MPKKKAISSNDLSPELLELMSLQGDIKVEFMRRGATERLAGELAGEALHHFALSKAIKAEYQKTYQALSDH